MLSNLFYLEELIVKDCPKLNSLLQKIGFYNCPKLKSLSTAELSSNNLKEIKGEKKWWETLTWSETEWGQQGHQRDYLHSIFSVVNREDDIMTQLASGGDSNR
ncbi:Disease resistance protein [Quillaja saponaria]|uniref:Disease resistance protein n=1 Tax=Quillaja saponaria TaxID=32244 RepID=A0AAD7M134_QUISA|nr:Disease resistance protein [Quillaja saponaria]